MRLTSAAQRHRRTRSAVLRRRFGRLNLIAAHSESISSRSPIQVIFHRRQVRQLHDRHPSLEFSSRSRRWGSWAIASSMRRFTAFISEKHNYFRQRKIVAPLGDHYPRCSGGGKAPAARKCRHNTTDNPIESVTY